MSGTEKVINSKQIHALVKEGVSTRDRNSVVSGQFGQRVAHAVENANLDRKAFNIALGLAKMKDEVARDRAIRDLPLYIDMLREEGVFPAEHVGDLVDDAEAAAAEEGAGDTDERDPAAAAADAAFSAEDGVEPQKPKASSRRTKVGESPATYRVN